MEKSKSEEGKIVQYDNLLNEEYRLNRLTGTEQDLFFAIVSEFNRVNRERTPEDPLLGIELPERVVKAYAGLNQAHTNVNYEKLKTMLFHIKMFTLTTLFNMKGFQRDPVTNEPVYDENHNLIPGVYTEAIFTSFFEGDKKKNIVIRMNPNAAAMFYHFNHGNFTQFFLKHHTKLKSKHSKTIYRQMLHGKNALKGSFVISKENLKLLIGYNTQNGFKKFQKSLPGYLEDIRGTGDFIYINAPQWIKGKMGKILSLEIQYRLNPTRMKAVQKMTLADMILQGKITPIYERKTETENGKTWVHKSPMYCPNCGSRVYAYITKKGEKQYLCENSVYWNLGEKNCKTERLPLENIWIEHMDRETETSSTSFQKPTIKEIKNYGQSWMEKNSIHKPIDYDAFYDYYESVGWKQKGTPILQWEPLLRNWIRRQKTYTSSVKERTKTKDPGKSMEEAGFIVHRRKEETDE